MVAVQAPDALEPEGAMFSAPALVAFSLTAFTVVAGYVVFGIALLRRGDVPRVATGLLVTGAVMGMVPPEPLGAMPWAGLVLGGVLYGAGAAWLGYTLWSEGSRARRS